MRVTVGIERLSSCPHQYELMEGSQAPVRMEYSGSLYLGSSVHRAVEWYLKEKEQGNRPELDDLLKAFHRVWLDGESLPDGWTLDRVSWGHAKDRAADEVSNFEDGLGMLNIYWPTLKEINPLLIEQEFITPIEGSDETVECHLDLVTTDMRLIDLKTGVRTKSKMEADTSLQFSTYAWALRKNGVWVPRDEKVEYHSLARLKKVSAAGRVNPTPYKFSIIESRRNLINFEWMDEIFLPRLVGMKKAGHFPASPGINCSMCPVRQLCGHWESIMQGREDLEFDNREFFE